MRKLIIGLSLLSAVFMISCSKDENVAKDYTYTFNEEFLDNEKGWFVDESKPEKFTFSQVDADNGLFNISYFSSFGFDIPTYSDSKSGGFNIANNFILATSLTWDASSGNFSAKSGKYCGLSWDVIDDKNYSKIGVSLNPTTLDVTYKVVKVVNGKSTDIVTPDSVAIVSTTPPVYTLKVEKIDNEFIFKINTAVVGTSSSVGLSSSNIGMHVDKDNKVNFHYLFASEE